MTTGEAFVVKEARLTGPREATVSVEAATIADVVSPAARGRAIMEGQKLGLQRAGLDPVNGLQPYAVNYEGEPIGRPAGVPGGSPDPVAAYRVDYQVRGM